MKTKLFYVSYQFAKGHFTVGTDQIYTKENVKTMSGIEALRKYLKNFHADSTDMDGGGVEIVFLTFQKVKADL